MNHPSSLCFKLWFKSYGQIFWISRVWPRNIFSYFLAPSLSIHTHTHTHTHNTHTQHTHTHTHTCVFMLSCFSHVQLFLTLWNSSLPYSCVHGNLLARILEWTAMPSSGDLPDPGIEPQSLMSPALTGGFFTTNATWEAHVCVYTYL